MGERIFLRVSEIAELIGCSKSKAYELVASGAISSTRIGSLLRVPRTALDPFIKRAPEEATAGGTTRNER
jgi:excisionase family DNA binding protein